jgi:prophage tail gpP-like protein
MTIKPEETATLVVKGRRFYDWETVFVQHRWAEPFPQFRFTVAERDRPATLWEKLQFAPGDECAIYLGGILSITGVILVRQTSYDANAHGVMLQGVGMTWYASRGSILDTKGNFDGMTFEQVARKVAAPFSVGVKTIGMLDTKKFDKLQVSPGENLWNFLERLARPRGIVMGSDHHGNILLIGDHASLVSAELIEGDNILKCQATISKEQMFSEYVVRGSTPADDSTHGRMASELAATITGTAKRYSPLLTPVEEPVKSPAEYAARAKNESIWHEGTIIRATITVQGWMMPGGGLWRTGDRVAVVSPMAMLNMGLKIETATFTQDATGGTLTVLELVAPWLLKDVANYDVGPGLPQPPAEEPVVDTKPPVEPTSGTVADPYPLLLDEVDL